MAAGGNLVANKKGLTHLKLFTLLGLGASTWSVLTFDANGAEYQDFINALNQAKNARNSVDKALDAGVVHTKLKAYLSAATGGFVDDALNIWTLQFLYGQLIPQLAK